MTRLHKCTPECSEVCSRLNALADKVSSALDGSELVDCALVLSRCLSMTIGEFSDDDDVRDKFLQEVFGIMEQTVSEYVAAEHTAAVH